MNVSLLVGQEHGLKLADRFWVGARGGSHVLRAHVLLVATQPLVSQRCAEEDHIIIPISLVEKLQAPRAKQLPCSQPGGLRAESSPLSFCLAAYSRRRGALAMSHSQEMRNLMLE